MDNVSANNSNAADTTITANVGRVSVRAPPFWEGDPNIWFAQIEAQFALGGITSDTTKYNHIIRTVDTAILTQSCLAVTNGTVEKLSKLADKIVETGQPRSVAAVSSDSTAELLKIERLSRREYGQQKRSSRARSHSNFKTWVPASDEICFYHTNFKHKAKKCVEPCKQYAAFIA
ncbi:Uncharacterized protein FWK35_00037578, partial [Aphis craccivora]